MLLVGLGLHRYASLATTGLLYLDILEFQKLGHLLVPTHTEDVRDDVMGGVAFIPERLEDPVCIIKLYFCAALQHLLDQQRVGLITNLQPHHSIMCRLSHAYILCFN